MYAVGREIGQCHVSLVQRVAGRLHTQPVFGGEAQEVVTVLAR